jgi:Protein of unknown function (DUF4230)
MSQSSRGGATIGFLLGLLTATLLIGLIWWLAARPGSRTVRIDASRPSVVSQIQKLQRLETVVFGMDKIVVGERESQYLPKFLAGDRLLLIVFGEVTAGIDLSRVQVSDVEVDPEGPAVRLKIPAPEIFSTRLDNERTRVYSRETGLFSRVDPDLETDVRREAERQVRQAALDGGIVDTARTNARATLESFLQGLGFAQVTVD